MDDRATFEEPRTQGRRLVPSEWLAVGLGSGLLGGVTLALPIVLWDWARSAHLAFELPMAATAWLFGLQHFSHATYDPWPVVIGIALLAGNAALSGLVFTGLADRASGITGTLQSVAAGLAWAFLRLLLGRAAADCTRRRAVPRNTRDGEPLRRSQLGLGSRVHAAGPRHRGLLRRSANRRPATTCGRSDR